MCWTRPFSRIPAQRYPESCCVFRVPPLSFFSPCCPFAVPPPVRHYNQSQKFRKVCTLHTYVYVSKLRSLLVLRRCSAPASCVRVPGYRHTNRILQELLVHASYSLAVRGIVAAFALAALGACQKSAPNQAPGGMPPPEVIVTVVQPHDLPANFEYVAQISGVR